MLPIRSYNDWSWYIEPHKKQIRLDGVGVEPLEIGPDGGQPYPNSSTKRRHKAGDKKRKARRKMAQATKKKQRRQKSKKRSK